MTAPQNQSVVQSHTSIAQTHYHQIENNKICHYNKCIIWGELNEMDKYHRYIGMIPSSESIILLNQITSKCHLEINAFIL